MHQVYLALGTNLNEREQNLVEAIQRLGEDVMVERVSPTYETEPWGVTDQPDFLNQVLRGHTTLAPHDLLVFIKQIEEDMGRNQDAIRNSPRLIDIDIIFYDNLILESPDLTIPHPRLEGRAFVLAPLADLDPELIHPALGRTVAELLEQTDLSTVTRYHPPPTSPRNLGEALPPPPAGGGIEEGGAKRRLPPIFWILVALLTLFLLIGAGSIGYYIYLTIDTGKTEEVTDIWSDLDAAPISPGLAIWTLADIEPEQIYRQAMANDELASATAMALTTPDLPNTQRLGWLTVLARRHLIAGDKTTTRYLLGLAADIAILEPTLADYQRAETMLDVANEWSALGESDKVRKLLDHATLITQRSTTLSPPIRQQILNRIAEVYVSLGDLDAARAIEALSSGGLPSSDTIPPPDPLASLRNELGYPEDMAQNVAKRKAEAQAFVDSWIESGGQTSRGQVLALEAALIDEDIRRTAFYQQQLADEALGVHQRALVLWDQVQWLIIKYRVANGLMGISLVPNWEAERPAIRQNLHDAFVELQKTLTDANTLLPTQQQPEAQVILYRHALIWARTGLYPDADQIFLGNALNDAIAQWEDATGIVPVAIIDEDGRVTFSLAPAGQQ